MSYFKTVSENIDKLVSVLNKYQGGKRLFIVTDFLDLLDSEMVDDVLRSYNDGGVNVLIEVIKKKDYKLLQNLLQFYDANPNGVDSSGHNAFETAVINNDTTAFKILNKLCLPQYRAFPTSTMVNASTYHKNYAIFSIIIRDALKEGIYIDKPSDMDRTLQKMYKDYLQRYHTSTLIKLCEIPENRKEVSLKDVEYHLKVLGIKIPKTEYNTKTELCVFLGRKLLLRRLLKKIA